MVRLLVVLLVAAAVVAAWLAPRVTPAGSPAGCGKTAAAGSQTLSLAIGGHDRTVIVHVPAAYAGRARTPLVLNLHGSGSTASQEEKFTGMDATADAHGFLLAYPQGAIPEASGFDWNVPGVPLIGDKPVPVGAADDVAFLKKLVVDLEQRYCVDPRRVYATGFSGGARLVSQLACGAARVIAAVAPVSGLRHPARCAPSRPVPIVAIHGTADPVDPYDGHGNAYWTYSVPAAARDWARQEQCAGKAAAARPEAKVTLLSYSRCSGRSTVELYTVAGDGHEWPGGPHLPEAYTALLGPQSNAIDADELIWSFFAAHRLP